MNRPQFTVSPEAAAFIRQYWQRPGVPQKVVVMQQELDVDPPTIGGEASTQDVIEHGMRYLASVSGVNRVRWAIGAAYVERVPKDEVVSVAGLLFAMNEELLELVGHRELVLDDGMLRFEPDLQPHGRRRGEERDS